MMLVRTGLKAALAAEIVSLWICIRVPLFDFLSTTTGTGAPTEAFVGDSGGGAAVDEDEEDFADEGSDDIRSINVIPEES